MAMRIVRWLIAASIAAAAGQQPATPLRTFTPEEVAALSQGMPEGKARELVVRTCAQCHEPSPAANLSTWKTAPKATARDEEGAHKK